MRISVIINPQAGTVDSEKVQRKVSQALFRCDLHFHISQSQKNGVLENMEEFIIEEIAHSTSAFVVCGGDGTINFTLQSMMRIKNDIENLPTFCLIRSGTANDLAHEMGISQRIDQAARQILEGRIKKIDILEVSSKGEKKYMLTNGGVGIPAITAARANKLRSMLRQLAVDGDKSGWINWVSGMSYRLVKKMGSSLYSVLLVSTIQQWEQKGWELEIEIPGNVKLSSKAPFVLVNNQQTLGRKYVTAPYSKNDDGLVNLLLVEGNTGISRLNSVLKVALGQVKEGVNMHSFEVPEFILRSKNKNRGLTFFGDGEILFQDALEIRVVCLRRSFNLVVSE